VRRGAACTSLQQFVAADAGRQDIAMSQLWSLTSRYANRISGPEKFRSSARKDFFNSIDPERLSDLRA
jgi:hypothetical protein